MLLLTATDTAVLAEVSRNKRIQPLLIGQPTPQSFVIDAWARGHIKQELLKIGWPAEDLAGYTPGTPHPIELDESNWTLRPYQRKAVDIFTEGGSGVVVLPCGAGKTLVGAAAMADTKTTTLDPRDEHRQRPAVARRAAQAHLAHRRGDRRVLGADEGDQARHDRDVPDPHRQARRAVRPPRAAGRPGLGPHRLRRGAPAARAGLQAHRRPAGAPPARA